MKSVGIDDSTKERTFEWDVPRISWGIFAVLSFITTALGMSETFFDGDWLGGLSISFGIQLLLLWMNRKMTMLFVQVRQKVLKMLIVLVYAVTVFWSAGFSYVYISDHVYRSVFMRDDQDKLVESYQRGMVTLKDLAERDLYDMLRMITEDVAELQVGTTSTETIQMENGAEAIEALKKAFVQDVEMLQIIDGAKKAMEGESFILTEDRMEMLEDTITEDNAEVKDKDREIREKEEKYIEWDEKAEQAAKERYKYKKGTAMDQFLEERVAAYTAEADKCRADIGILEEERKKIKEIIGDLEALQSYLSLLKESTDVVIASSFIEILTLLGQKDLGAEEMSEAERLADEVFRVLSERSGKEKDNAVYAEKMKVYMKLKEHLAKLRDIRLVQEHCKDAQQGAVLADTEAMVASYPSKEVVGEWRARWNTVYGGMKSDLYQLPSAARPEVIETCDQIARLQRSLLTELNGVERGIYYLTCPHPLLAWLAFLLALFLDSSSIIFMLVKAELGKIQEPGAVPGDLVPE